MKAKYAPIVAAILLIGSTVVPSYAQLPPTNMGKFVHQPGDNQYNVNSQMERHGTSYIDRTGPGGSVMVPHGGGGGGGGPMPSMAAMAVNPMVLLGSNTPKVDVSIEPISADEPVPPGGFPPLPERLQLPIAQNASWNPSAGGRHGGGGGGGPVMTGVHQHYQHAAAGSYQSGGGGGGGGGYVGPGDEAVPGIASGGGAGVAPPANVPPSHYYKCGTAPSPMVHRNFGGGSGDTFNANPGMPQAPRYSGASSADLKSLGKAPTLDDKADGAGAPEAPQAATVTQSTTQDLSLPDDEFVSRYGVRNSAAGNMGRMVGRTLRYGIYSSMGRIYSLIP